MHDDLELICRYRYLIPVKMARCLHHDEWDDEPDAALADAVEAADEGHEPGEALLSDHLGTAKLLDELLTKTAQALWRLGEFEPRWLEDAMLCATGAEAIRTKLGRTYPGLASVKRPGFDRE